MTSLPDVQVVGAFCYSAPGCEGPNYSSWIVVREDESGQSLADFAGRRLAFNSEDSQSGYRSMMKMTQGPEYFSATHASGGHRRSVAMIRRGKADIAAIDCISWALLLRDFPEELSGVKIIGQTASVPGLPVITSAETSADSVARLREGLAQLVANAADTPLLESLLIKDFTPLPRAAWHVILR